VTIRDFCALTIVYILAALFFVFLAIFTAGDCPVLPTKVAYESCLSGVYQRLYGSIAIAVLGYPAVLVWYVRRHRRK